MIEFLETYLSLPSSPKISESILGSAVKSAKFARFYLQNGNLLAQVGAALLVKYISAVPCDSTQFNAYRQGVSDALGFFRSCAEDINSKEEKTI